MYDIQDNNKNTLSTPCKPVPVPLCRNSPPVGHTILLYIVLVPPVTPEELRLFQAWDSVCGAACVWGCMLTCARNV